VVRKTTAPDTQQSTLKATRALVKTGARLGDRVVITQGLAPGDMVVIVGQMKLQDGAEVALVENKTLTDAAAKRGTRLE
jgi:membrane fusion protein, multidrug efflux system